MSNNITIELCAEDRKRIDELIAFAGLIVAGMNHHNTTDVPVFTQEPTTPGTFADRLREAMEAAGVKQIDLVRDLGLDKGAVSSYLAGKYEPKQKAVMAMANYLNVSELWLLGYDVPVLTQEPAEEHPVDAVVPHELPEPAAEPEQPKYSKADVLAKVQQLAGPNCPHREQAKAIVKSYGAKVSDIPVDKYAEVMAKLAELEG